MKQQLAAGSRPARPSNPALLRISSIPELLSNDISDCCRLFLISPARA
jgi:hypothetical protein